MSPLSVPVLGAAALVASPALYAGLVEGTMPIDLALTRYLVAVGVCWGLLSLLVELALPSAASLAAAEQRETAGASPDAPPGARSSGPGEPSAAKS